MVIHPVGAELFNADRRTDIRKQTGAFRRFANAPSECSTNTNYIMILKIS